MTNTEEKIHVTRFRVGAMVEEMAVEVVEMTAYHDLTRGHSLTERTLTNQIDMIDRNLFWIMGTLTPKPGRDVIETDLRDLVQSDVVYHGGHDLEVLAHAMMHGLQQAHARASELEQLYRDRKLTKELADQLAASAMHRLECSVDELRAWYTE